MFSKRVRGKTQWFCAASGDFRFASKTQLVVAQRVTASTEKEARAKPSRSLALTRFARDERE